MGLWVQFVWAKRERWEYRELPEGEWADLEVIVSEAGTAALAAQVEDSDTAYAVAGTGDGVAWRVRLNPGRGEPDAVAEWSRAHAPKRIAAARVAEVLSRDWTFAEDGLDDLLAPMRLAQRRSELIPGFRGLVALHDVSIGSQLVGGRIVDPSRDLRYVAGQGRDFFGIWDTARKGTPVERFPYDDRGAQACATRLRELAIQPRLEQLELSGRRWVADVEGAPPDWEGRTPVRAVAAEQRLEHALPIELADGLAAYLVYADGSLADLTFAADLDTLAQLVTANTSGRVGTWRELPGDGPRRLADVAAA